MVAKPGWITGWTGQHVRHAAAMVRQGANPAARVYESIGADSFLTLAPGWLNLGLWEGPGSEDEAENACRRLVATLASALPAGGVIVDVGNGLGTQDPLIAETLRPRRLVAVNITRWQLVAGRDRLREAAAAPVAGDAARLPLADSAVDGVISVEAAFHFSSRKAFFEECYRVLRPGGDPVPGLYAAGNAAASVMGMAYPGGGSTLGPALTFGHLAGRHAAARR